MNNEIVKAKHSYFFITNNNNKKSCSMHLYSSPANLVLQNKIQCNESFLYTYYVLNCVALSWEIYKTHKRLWFGECEYFSQALYAHRLWVIVDLHNLDIQITFCKHISCRYQLCRLWNSRSEVEGLHVYGIVFRISDFRRVEHKCNLLDLNYFSSETMLNFPITFCWFITYNPSKMHLP